MVERDDDIILLKRGDAGSISISDIVFFTFRCPQPTNSVTITEFSFFELAFGFDSKISSMSVVHNRVGVFVD